MPSRRRLLAGVGVGAVGLSGGRHLFDAPVSTTSDVETDWPMARYDPSGTGYNPNATGPKDGVEVAWQRDTESNMF